MFRRSTIQTLVFFLVLALILRIGLLVLFAALLLATAGIAWLWNRYSLRRVSYERHFSTNRAFPGDMVELVVTITNRKPLPLAMLEIHDRMPIGIDFDDPDIRFERDDRQHLTRTTSLRWYERVVWRYEGRCLRRGAYRTGPAQLDASDPFGFFRSTEQLGTGDSLIVYPLLLPLDELRLPARNPIGAIAARQLIRDPMRTIGVRDYHPDDPIKDVHWSATARTGTLQTRIYEPTTARELAIVLDLDSFEAYWQGVDEAQVERLISAAATLAKRGLQEGYAVGLYVNGAPAQFEQLVRLPPGRSPVQLERIMETLARLSPYSVTPVARVLRMAASDLPWGATVLLLSAIQPQATRAELSRLREHGRAVTWLYIGEDKPPHVPGIHIHYAPPAQDWRKNSQVWARPEEKVRS